jgi:hypothetical protein
MMCWYAIRTLTSHPIKGCTGLKIPVWSWFGP